VLNLLDTVGHDEKMSSILLHYNREKVQRAFTFLREKILPELELTNGELIQEFRRNLFPSLVGSFDVEYSEEAFEAQMAVLGKIINRWQCEKVLLAQKKAERDRALQELSALVEQCYSGELLEGAKLVAGEKIASLKMLKAKIKYVLIL